MSEGPAPLRVAGLGDLHVSEDRPQSWRELFAEVSQKADVLALCGDLTNLGRPREAEILAEDLKACSIPVVAVLGNHDYECGHVEEIGRILRHAGVRLLDGGGCEIRNVGFVGVKGFAGGFGRRMLGAFGEEVIKTFVAETMNEAMRLEIAMRAVKAERAVVLLHYAPVEDTVRGEPPEIFPFLGCSRLAETIDRFKVSAVLHGHAHQGTYEGRTPNGISVYNCAHMIPKPGGRPYALIEV
jgi:Icc-related predicted phosphoesterase